jgi:predicted enzyme related to lactoylglutathione lyase
MPQTATHAPGKFCWVEIGTTDKNAARKFYTTLFGWKAKDVPAGEMGTYTILGLDGRDVGGLYELNQEQRDQGVPPHWLSYVSVEDAAKATNKAESLGAEVVMGPMDVMEIGRMSVLKDPQGAVFAIWQAKQHPGFGVVDEKGSPCWFELATSDTKAAGKFYSGVFGWGLDTQAMGAMNYTMLKVGKESVAGVMALTPEMKKGNVPPNWLPYIRVEDSDGTAKKATSLGGKVLHGPMDVPNVGRFAVLADPTGAAFAVIRLNG